MSILLGIYIGIMVCVFFVTGFVIVLGGKDKDIWKPFVYAPFWIVFVPLYMLKVKRYCDKW